MFCSRHDVGYEKTFSTTSLGVRLKIFDFPEGNLKKRTGALIRFLTNEGVLMRYIYLLIISLTISACLPRYAMPTRPTPTVVGTPSAGSMFSKVQLGMSRNQAESIIGVSKDCHYGMNPGYSTFFDSWECTYKNEGILTFDHRTQTLVKITVDTSSGEFRAIQK